jgi:hypothetical protein
MQSCATQSSYPFLSPKSATRAKAHRHIDVNSHGRFE